MKSNYEVNSGLINNKMPNLDLAIIWSNIEPVSECMGAFPEEIWVMMTCISWIYMIQEHMLLWSIINP